MKSLVLIGFMGTGKTTLGKALAERLARPLVDLDDVIVREQGMEIGELFAQVLRSANTCSIRSSLLCPGSRCSSTGRTVLSCSTRRRITSGCAVRQTTRQ